MLLFQQKRRKEAQHGILRDVDQQAVGMRAFQNRLARNRELKRLDRAYTADLGCDVKLGRQLLQLLLEVGAHAAHLLQQIFVFENRQILKRDAAGQRASAERRSVLARRNVLRKLLFRQKRAERQARGDWLGDAHYGGRHSEMLEREELPRPSHAALDFVENQCCLMLISQLPARLQKLGRRFLD